MQNIAYRTPSPSTARAAKSGCAAAETRELTIHQASVEVPGLSAMSVAEALEAALDPAPIAVGWFERGEGRFEVFAHFEAPPPRDSLLKLTAAICDGEGLGPLQIETIPPADWVKLSQGQRGKVAVGRFLIHGSHDSGKLPRRVLAIEIDAGQAFGTAHHASTRGCLLALDDLLKRSRPREIIDLGTGTGVLAIAAAKTLRRSLIASDSDKIAVATAKDNARKNGVGSLVVAFVADGFAHRRLRSKKADLLFANLFQRTHYELAPAFARHVLPGGAAILSGLMRPQVRAIEARLRAHGFILKKRIILDGWATLVIVRRSSRRVGD